MASKYNPYDAVKNISELKGKYHTAKQLGDDYKPYQEQAKQYYQELTANGYADVADELNASDYIKSLDVLARYKPTQSYDELYDNISSGYGDGFKITADDEPATSGKWYENTSGGTSGTSVSALPTVNYQTPSITADDYKKMYDDILGDGEDIRNMVQEATKLATGETKPVVSDAVQNIFDIFTDTNNRLNGDITYDANGNVVSGLNLDHYNTGKNQLDVINNFDYTKQPYYESIMQSFALGGDNAAKDALASGAAGNSGNLDSYAAANANRQQLAFTSAGHEAALAAAQQNQANWQTLYDAMSGNLSDMGAINAQNLATGADMYATDSAERQNALNQAAALADSEAQRRLDAWYQQLADATTRYGIDADVAIQREANELQKYGIDTEAALQREANELQKYGIDVEAQLQRESNELQKYGIDAETANNLALQKLVNEGNLATAQTEAEYQKAVAQMNNTAAYEQLLAEIAGQKEIANAELAAQERITNAELAAQERMNTANNTSEYERLLAELTSQEKLAEIARQTEINEIKNSYGSPVEDAALVRRSALTDEQREQEMKEDIQAAMNAMKNGTYDDIKTVDDVVDTMLEVYPGKEDEIREYISTLVKASTSTVRPWDFK